MKLIAVLSFQVHAALREKMNAAAEEEVELRSMEAIV